MYTQILVPLDGSPVSEQVLPYARLFAKAFAIPMELLCVVDPEKLHEENGEALEKACAESLQYLEGISGSITGDLPAKLTVERGDPAERIGAVAAARENLLIAMSTHGRSGVKRWLLGSVAEKTVEVTTHPLLLVRAQKKKTSTDNLTLTKLLVPLDGSPVAEQVLPHVNHLAQTMGFEVLLLRAYEMHVRGHSVRMRQIRETVQDSAEAYLNEKAHELRAQGLPAVSCRVEQGHAAETIVRVARDLSETLIAMSTHGRSGVRRWVLGSVASRIVRHANDPVLLIRARAQDSRTD